MQYYKDKDTAFEDLRKCGGMKLMFSKWDGKVTPGFSWQRYAPVAVCCEHGDEPSVSINCGKFYD
jgi:hypothetical protein